MMNQRKVAIGLLAGALTAAATCGLALGQAGGGKTKADQKASGGAPAAPTGGWTIVLSSHAGDGHAAAAAADCERVRQMPGFEGARVEQRGRGSVVSMGAFGSPADEGAQRELARARGALVEGRRAFPGAFLAPPNVTDVPPGALERFDLRRAREEFGDRARYTLQIGVYESKKREESKKAAEDAASRLRREGEPAYFFHGAERSMVTVGAFTEREAEAFLARAPGQKTGAGSSELWEWFRRHPENLLNGNLTLVEKVSASETKRGKRAADAGRTQASFLVEIP